MDKYTRIVFLSISVSFLTLLTMFAFFFYSMKKDTPVLGVGEITNKETSPLEQVFFKGHTFKYNSSVFNIEENDDKILILPQSLRTFQYALLTSLDSESSVSEIFEQNPLYPNLLTENSKEIEIYNVDLYSYDQISFLHTTSKERAFLTVYSVTNSNNLTFYIEVRDFNYEINPEIHENFLNILRSMNQANEVLGTDSTQIDLARVLGQSSTLRIFAKICYDAKFSSELSGSLLAGNTYTICNAAVGSGFVVTPYGDILTNAHIVKPHPFDCLADGASTDGTYEKIMIDEIGETLYFLLGDYMMFLTPSQIETFYIYVVNEAYKTDYLTITEKSRNIYVQTSNSFEFDSEAYDLANKDLQYSATLIKANDIASYYQTVMNTIDADELLETNSEDSLETSKIKDGLTGVSDLALIKLDVTRPFTSLKISEQKPMQGQNIYVIGYPEISNDEMTTSTTNILASTVTTGSITTIKQNTKNTFDLLQVDASIESGNSGGPMVDNLGDILGITTYTTSSGSGNYNLGISSTEIEKFLSESGITTTQSKESETLISAVSDISKSYYSRSQKKLEGLVDGEATLGITLSPLIEMCTTNIGLGYDKSPWIDLKFINIPNWGLLTIGGILLVLFILIVIVIASKRKKKNIEYVEPMFQGPEHQAPVEQVVTPQAEINEGEKGYLRPQQPQAKTIQQPIPTNSEIQPPVQNTPITTPVEPVQNQAISESPQSVSEPYSHSPT